jgi:hypothetical protein
MTAYSKDANSERLLQLSDEVSRIAGRLARLSADAPPAPHFSPADDVAPEVTAETILRVVRARRLRGRFVPEELFADPAWDMMLDLLQAELSHQRIAVSSLCAASAVPATTALRWISTLAARGLFIRRADPHDGRRIFVELAPETSKALRRYFAEVHAPVI